MKTVMISICALALACGLFGCARATANPPTTGHGGPSPLVVSLDAVEVSAAAAAPWFPGATGAWLAEVQPTAQSIAADLQVSDPFARAQSYIGTFQQVIASAPATATLSKTQIAATQSIVGAMQAFLVIYEQQAGIAPGATLQAHQAIQQWEPSAADKKLLKALAG